MILNYVFGQIRDLKRTVHVFFFHIFFFLFSTIHIGERLTILPILYQARNSLTFSSPILPPSPLFCYLYSKARRKSNFTLLLLHPVLLVVSFFLSYLCHFFPFSYQPLLFVALPRSNPAHSDSDSAPAVAPRSKLWLELPKIVVVV